MMHGDGADVQNRTARRVGGTHPQSFVLILQKPQENEPKQLQLTAECLPFLQARGLWLSPDSRNALKHLETFRLISAEQADCALESRRLRQSQMGKHASTNQSDHWLERLHPPTDPKNMFDEVRRSSTREVTRNAKEHID